MSGKNTDNYILTSKPGLPMSKAKARPHCRPCTQVELRAVFDQQRSQARFDQCQSWRIYTHILIYPAKISYSNVSWSNTILYKTAAGLEKKIMLFFGQTFHFLSLSLSIYRFIFSLFLSVSTVHHHLSASSLELALPGTCWPLMYQLT